MATLILSRSSAALAECHAHWDAAVSTPSPQRHSGGGGGGPTSALHRAQLSNLARAMQRTSMCSTNMSVRAVSLRALLWLHTPTLLPGVPDAAVLQFRTGEWTASAIDDVMQTLQQRLAATPSMAAEILRLASAVVEAVPARVRPEAVVRLWEAALLAVLGQDELCAFAVQDFLLMLHARPRGGDAESAAGVERHTLQAVRFLGSHVNAAAGESAGGSGGGGEEQNNNIRSALLLQQHTLAARDAACDTAAAAEALVAAAARKPLLARVITTLQRCAMMCSWGVRVEAVTALGKIAVRSGEPYRVQCYEGFVVLMRMNVGLTALVSPVVELLDKMYLEQARLLRVTAASGADARQ